VGSTLFSTPMVALLRHPGHKILRTCCRESARKRLIVIRSRGVFRLQKATDALPRTRLLGEGYAFARISFQVPTMEGIVTISKKEPRRLLFSTTVRSPEHCAPRNFSCQIIRLLGFHSLGPRCRGLRRSKDGSATI